MNPFSILPSVHGLDKRLQSRTAHGNGAAARRPAAPPIGLARSALSIDSPRDIRFREAIPDYRTLLGAGAPSGIDPFTAACVERWAVRWTARKIRSIEPDEVLEYLRELSQKGHTCLEVEREKSLLGSFYRWARRAGLAVDDPTQGLKPLRTPLDEVLTPWTGAEQRRLLDACRGLYPGASASSEGDPPPSYLYPLVLLGLRTGLRLGNLLNLEWRHVDLETERILMARTELRSARPLDIPLQRDATSLLGALHRQAGSFSRPPRRVLEVVHLPFWQGQPDDQKVLHAFRRTRKRAGIQEGDFGSLRLTFVRNCACAGIPADDVARITDWEDPELLTRIYEDEGRKRREG